MGGIHYLTDCDLRDIEKKSRRRYRAQLLRRIRKLRDEAVSKCNEQIAITRISYHSGRINMAEEILNMLMEE